MLEVVYEIALVLFALVGLFASVLTIVGWWSKRHEGGSGGGGVVHYLNAGWETTRIFVVERVVIQTIERVREIPVPVFPKIPRPRRPEWMAPSRRPWRTPEDDQPPIERRPGFVPERRPFFSPRHPTHEGDDFGPRRPDFGIGGNPREVDFGGFPPPGTNGGRGPGQGGGIETRYSGFGGNRDS